MQEILYEVKINDWLQNVLANEAPTGVPNVSICIWVLNSFRVRLEFIVKWLLFKKNMGSKAE